MRTFLSAAAFAAFVAAAPSAVVADDKMKPKFQASDKVCVMQWGLKRDRGYCGTVEELKDGKARIKVSDIKAPRVGGRGTSCSEGKRLKELRTGDVLTVAATCVSSKM